MPDRLADARGDARAEAQPDIARPPVGVPDAPGVLQQGVAVKVGRDGERLGGYGGVFDAGKLQSDDRVVMVAVADEVDAVAPDRRLQLIGADDVDAGGVGVGLAIAHAHLAAVDPPLDDLFQNVGLLGVAFLLQHFLGGAHQPLHHRPPQHLGQLFQCCGCGQMADARLLLQPPAAQIEGQRLCRCQANAAQPPLPVKAIAPGRLFHQRRVQIALHEAARAVDGRAVYLQPGGQFAVAPGAVTVEPFHLAEQPGALIGALSHTSPLRP